MKNYILVDKVPVEEPDVIKWAQWYEKTDRRVYFTILPTGENISTVFLGLDHSWNGKKHLFETMIFSDNEHDGYCERYSTYEQALEGHQRAIELIFEV